MISNHAIIRVYAWNNINCQDFRFRFSNERFTDANRGFYYSKGSKHVKHTLFTYSILLLRFHQIIPRLSQLSQL